MTPTQEMAVVQRILGGDSNAFEILVIENQKRVYNLALKMVKNEEDALDLSQEAFLKAYRSLSQFRGDSTFSVWMYRLTSNVCIDFLRKKKKQNVISLVYTNKDEGDTEMEIADTRFSPEQQLEKSELRRAVAEGLDQLSEEHRQILIMREINGYTYEEIASALFLELGTVKSRIARARLALRTILESGGNFYASDSSNKGKGGKSV